MFTYKNFHPLRRGHGIGSVTVWSFGAGFVRYERKGVGQPRFVSSITVNRHSKPGRLLVTCIALVVTCIPLVVTCSDTSCDVCQALFMTRLYVGDEGNAINVWVQRDKTFGSNNLWLNITFNISTKDVPNLKITSRMMSHAQSHLSCSHSVCIRLLCTITFLSFFISFFISLFLRLLGVTPYSQCWPKAKQPWKGFNAAGINFLKTFVAHRLRHWLTVCGRIGCTSWGKEQAGEEGRREGYFIPKQQLRLYHGSQSSEQAVKHYIIVKAFLS